MDDHFLAGIRELRGEDLRTQHRMAACAVGDAQGGEPTVSGEIGGKRPDASPRVIGERAAPRHQFSDVREASCFSKGASQTGRPHSGIGRDRPGRGTRHGTTARFSPRWCVVAATPVALPVGSPRLSVTDENSTDEGGGPASRSPTTPTALRRSGRCRGRRSWGEGSEVSV